jgi:NAD-dependent DNA ligase
MSQSKKETIETKSSNKKKQILSLFISDVKKLSIDIKDKELLHEEFLKQLTKYTEKELEYFITFFKKTYYNETPLITDDFFDLIEEYMKIHYPTNKTLNNVGSEHKKAKIKLPFYMGSLNKIKHTTPDLIDKWCQKFQGKYVIQPKLDGVSGMLTKINGVSKLYTRGDGNYGQDISHLLKYLDFPSDIYDDTCFRGEFVMKKQIFKEKYQSNFSNSRNMVCGLINQKPASFKNPSVASSIKDITFIVYEIIQPIMSPSDQIIRFVCLTDTENFKTTQFFISYDVDGLVIKNDEVYEREINENPKHHFAFKMNIETNYATSRVIDVIWNPSKDGYLKPQVLIEQVYLDGVYINYTTGFNAGYIKTNKIGPGALLKIMRSGSVIPHIVEVLEPSPSGEKMPNNISYK